VVYVSNNCFRSKNFASRNVIRGYSSVSPSKIGLFGDIHFQDKGLERINETASWIVDEFKKKEVDAVVCLGIKFAFSMNNLIRGCTQHQGNCECQSPV
jgi:formylmethanofuran dehydrogenase subunit B